MATVMERDRIRSAVLDAWEEAEKVLNQRFWRGSQGWNYQFLTEIEGHRVRVRIYRDSYDDQSYARAYVWSDAELKWNLAASIPYPDMETLLMDAYVANGDDWRWYEQDEAALLEEVRWLLSSG